MLEKGIVKTDDTTEAVGKPEEKTSQEENAVIDSSLAEDVTEETTKVETEEAPSIDLSEFKLDRFKDLNEVSEYVNYRDRKYGEQANELGELRQKRDDYEKLKSQITGKEVEKSTTTEISDTELAQFAEAFNRNPYAAIEKYYMPKIKESLKSELFESLKEKFSPVLEEQATGLATKQEFASFARNNADYQKFSGVMSQLMTEQYLGVDVPFEEAYKLAKLSEEEKSLFSETCGLMKRGLPFEEAKSYAALKQGAATNADAKKLEVKKEIAKVGPGLKRSVTKQITSEPKIETMDDVVDSMVT